MNLNEIQSWLQADDPARLAELWARADTIRRENVGDEVHLRGLIEIGNFCGRDCAYCGLGRNADVERYRMTADEILAAAHRAVEYGYGTVVLQSGEDFGMTAEWITAVIRQIKTKTTLAVTLSLGERSDTELAAWRDAGADRYLLRFETSNPQLFDIIHPPLHKKPSNRLAILGTLKALGYEVGSGVMVGIPGQTYADLARDIALFRELDLDMIGLGPYVPVPGSRLEQLADDLRAPQGEQVPNDELTTYKTLALTRLICPWTNIPSTTALASITGGAGRELGLQRGANVIMPNVTPPHYRSLYCIYPAKACLTEDANHFHEEIRRRIASLGRCVGKGRGDCIRRVTKGVAP